MLEQTTIQQGLMVAESWGPVGTLAITWLIYQIIYQQKMNKHAVEPSIENKQKIDALQLKCHKLELDLKDRVNYTWVEDKLAPKIDLLNTDVSKLSVSVEKYSVIGEQMVGAVDRLTRAIEAHDDRLNELERR